MFGHQDDTTTDQVNNQTAANDPAVDASLASEPGAPAPATDTTDTLVPPVETPSAPAVDSNAANDFLTHEPNQPNPLLHDDAGADASVATPAVDDNLLTLKQQALQQLTPLVGHLDQTPEERFRTTMMMIQAADNKDLLRTAYEAAQAIPDEKVRAQALLDVVNEINYFTQPHDQQQAA